MPVCVVFNQINVLSMSSNSIVASGQNSQPDWNSQGKMNSGIGNYVNSVVFGCSSVINDPDFVDTPIAQPEGINLQPTSQI
ncbi:hypothetical protein FZC84_00610 [Rossellomorea vietnamensis]|uniref:Spore germination protein n=1 Tax=Rossellomorea vietnamensis TaxID=218284 RepID=A0A5D4MH47_9BACI|nr:hypothetical protein [Rossellomorea vietnamensis]TYS01205.1 hypothetical protein FZC84_00610 [Rossellomorea vietnamensis]